MTLAEKKRCRAYRWGGAAYCFCLPPCPSLCPCPSRGPFRASRTPYRAASPSPIRSSIQCTCQRECKAARPCRSSRRGCGRWSPTCRRAHPTAASRSDPCPFSFGARAVPSCWLCPAIASEHMLACVCVDGVSLLCIGAGRESKKAHVVMQRGLPGVPAGQVSHCDHCIPLCHV